MAHEPDGLHYLLIEKAGPEHAGKLAIIASNNNGNTTSEAKLSVTCKLIVFSLFIKIKQYNKFNRYYEIYTIGAYINYLIFKL